MNEIKYTPRISTQLTQRITGYLLVKTGNPDVLSRKLTSGIQRFFGGFGRNAHLYKLGNFQFGLLLPEKLPDLDCVSLYRDKDNFSFIEGTFYDFDLLRKSKQTDLPISEELAYKLLGHVKNQDFQALKSLNGRYSGFIYEATSDTLTVFNDKHGGNNLFIYQNGKDIALSNNLFAIAGNPDFEVSVNDQGIAEAIQIEYPLFDGTEFNEIKILLPSTVYRISQERSESLLYFNLPQRKQQHNKEAINELSSAFNDFFQKLYNYLNEPIGLYLSKGKDSRIFLPFLIKNNIPFSPYVFKEDTGVFDYPFVKQIAELLNTDLHVLDSYEVDPRLLLLVAMCPTNTSSWFALGSAASMHVGNALLGLDGDVYSGKLTTFRTPDVNDRISLVEKYFQMVCKGVDTNTLNTLLPHFSKFDNLERFQRMVANQPSTNTVLTDDLFINNEYRTFRNSQRILSRAAHFVTPIFPFLEDTIANKYLTLPITLIKSQKAHTIIAASESRSNSIRSTAFPVSLKLEKNIRPLLISTIRLNRKFNLKMLAWQKKKYNPVVDSEVFSPRSDYFKIVLKKEDQLISNNKRLITRLQKVDNFLHLVMHDNILPLCNKPDICKNEFEQHN